jgi:hypothetical protein
MTQEIVSVTYVTSSKYFLLKELGSGVWTISTAFLLVVVIWFMIAEIRRNKKWYNHEGVQMGFAFVVLMVGHLALSSLDWLEFALINHGLKATLTSYSSIFVISIGLILIGKTMCLMVLTPNGFRRLLLAWLLMVSSITVPCLVYVVLP